MQRGISSSIAAAKQCLQDFVLGFRAWFWPRVLRRIHNLQRRDSLHHISFYRALILPPILLNQLVYSLRIFPGSLVQFAIHFVPRDLVEPISIPYSFKSAESLTPILGALAFLTTPLMLFSSWSITISARCKPFSCRILFCRLICLPLTFLFVMPAPWRMGKLWLGSWSGGGRVRFKDLSRLIDGEVARLAAREWIEVAARGQLDMSRQMIGFHASRPFLQLCCLSHLYDSVAFQIVCWLR